MNNIIRKNSLWNAFIMCLFFSISAVSVVFASKDTNLLITINPGTLAVDMVDASFNAIEEPIIQFDDIAAGFECVSANGVLGTLEKQIYITNPDAARDGYTVSLAGNGVWSNGSKTFSYNDETADVVTNNVGCATGQLTVSEGVISDGRLDSDLLTGISPSGGAFSSQNSSVTLINASSASENISEIVATGFTLTQKIPAQTPAGDYSLDMVLSILSNGLDSVSTAPVLLSSFNAYNDYYLAADIAANDFSKPLMDDSYVVINNAVVDGSDDALDVIKTIDSSYNESTSSTNASSFAINYMFFKFFSNDSNASIKLYTQNPLVNTTQTPVGSSVGSIIIPNYCVYNYPVYGATVYSNCNAGYASSSQTHPILYILLENSYGSNLYVLNSQQG